MVECSGGLARSVWVDCVSVECCDGTGGRTYSSYIKLLRDCVLKFKLDVWSVRTKNWHSGEPQSLALGVSTLLTVSGRKRESAPTVQPAYGVNPHHLGVTHQRLNQAYVSPNVLVGPGGNAADVE